MPASPLQKLVKLYTLSNMLNNPNCNLARAGTSTDVGVAVFHTISLITLFSSKDLPFHTVPALTSTNVQSIIQKAALLIRIHGCPQGYVIPRKNRVQRKSILLM